jgi:hypothetical protein
MAVTGPLHGGAPSEHDLLELAFPIMGVSAGKEARAVCGTAFALGSDMYLTAGHVWQNALTFPLQAIGIRHPNAPDVTLYHVEDAEVLGAFDLAILRAPSTAAPNKALIWTTEALPLFAEVRPLATLTGWTPNPGC